MQTSFSSRAEKTKATLRQAAARGPDYETVIGLVSGGTDSLCAIDAYRRYHDTAGLPSLDAVVHTVTGTTIPQTSRTVQQYCAREPPVPYIEVRQQEPERQLAPRVLEHGWPLAVTGESGHWPEFINRKLDTWDRVMTSFSRPQLWISGARYAESDRRARTLGDGAVDVGEPGDRRYQTWVAPCHGWLDADKKGYIDNFYIPRTPAYDFLGYSGDCTACSFDDPRILNEIRLLSPELAHCLQTLAVWVYQRIKRGEIDVPMKRSVWGMPHESKEKLERSRPDCERVLEFGGCSDPNCKASKAQYPSQ